MASEKNFEKQHENPMTKVRIEKVTINAAIGKPGEPLDKAAKILEFLTDQKPCLRSAKSSIKDFGIRKGEPIACVVTLRKQKAEEFLKKAFTAIGNKITKSNFDNAGNFAFGINEHIELPGVKYDPALGIIGMDICVTVAKPGYRVKNKRISSRIGARHRVTSEESISYIRDIYGIEILEK